MTTLGQANPYFVRCIKPNGDKAPNYFTPDMVLNQLKYSGTMFIRLCLMCVSKAYHTYHGFVLTCILSKLYCTLAACIYIHVYTCMYDVTASMYVNDSL